MGEESSDVKATLNPYWLEQGYGARFQLFQNLMPYRIRSILLVSSLYDLFLFEEDGRLYELLREEYQGLNLTHAPELTRVSSGREAIALAKDQRRFDLIITTLHIEDMDAYTFARRAREAGLDLPIVLLAYDQRELSELLLYRESDVFDQVFVWQGDFRLIIAIIKHLEDKLNVENDTRMVGVQSIILIEDRVQYYSSFLPIIYLELFKQSQRLITEGINLSHKFLRMRARPKILLSTNFEEAWNYFSRYQDYILGVISDIDFKRNGVEDPKAGIEFARLVKKHYADIPILLQSDSPENAQDAHKVGASFVLKNSPTLLTELRQFMLEHFGFGDFVFRTEDGREVGRAHDLLSLEEQLKVVPDESIRYHAERNHFSNWLKARTEFWLAHKLRPRKVSDFESIQALRELLINSISEYRKIRQQGLITDFNKATFYPLSSFSRIGRGSLGGKARGLSFISKLIYNYKIYDKFDGVQIYVPPAIVLATEVFDRFLEMNDLHGFALNCTDDREIVQRFVTAERFPEDVVQNLREFLQIINIPLAVRSSSLLEDSQYYPFAGVYKTFMLPNRHQDLNVRLRELLSAIKRVYASTFCQNAKNYFKVTSYRLEEEKMAVVIQKMIGKAHASRFYPDFAGVAKSYNFYPVAPQTPKDGIAMVALGLGKMVVEGGESVKFCPKYPTLLPQFSTTEETLKNSQRTFYALNLEGCLHEEYDFEDHLVEQYDLSMAEKDGTLTYVGSTYSHQNHTVYDGISRQGHRLVTFAPILKHKLFPLPKILDLLLEIGSWAMGTAVEIEFAVNLAHSKSDKHQMGLLQMRPLVLRHELDALEIQEVERSRLICHSHRVMGNGIINDIRDIVVVDIHKFDRLRSREAALEVTRLNQKLLNENRPYLLVGVGRWGSLDPLLGIPVKWEHISGAKVIVETGFKDLNVTPSQGSHFFHNLTSFRVAYFTVTADDFLDWKWLLAQKPLEHLKFTRLIRLPAPITVKINGPQNEGVILKPEATPDPKRERAGEPTARTIPATTS